MKRCDNAWLNFATVDLNSAGKLLEDDSLTQSAAFHCQQTIEKSFKALLEYKNIAVPRVHDLIRLHGLLLEAKIEIAVDDDMLAQINDVYIETRYPSNFGLIPSGIPEVSTVQHFYQQAETILEKAWKQIQPV
jgi:HEPN domain-containing protein